ncbi:hypothetical protein MHW99_07220 [Corynebacterium sp. ACRPX]|uniref:hypothetical protein n=1 Tax=Corynebacterium sp. ACRPX TaxID=2918185 RepID=UPI001EF684B6|nr:hypothetical protein [Corynebacterium sp. ACRPX]MCG7245625.1 hypothetical protein [Corynebacterium sp. ACRPX]
MSKRIRHEDPYDEDLFWQVIERAETINKHVTPIVSGVVAAAGLTELEPGDDLLGPGFNTGVFVLSSRAKTKTTTIEKLKRQHTSIDRVDDMSGIRIDAAITLTKQSTLAQELADALENAGATRHRIKDHRDQPQSGYRAVHVVAEFPAGRVEVQIRTAIQSLWANTYEVLADKFGRRIRYGDWESLKSPVDRNRVELLHDLSDVIYAFERSVDHFKHFGRDSIEQKEAEEIEHGHAEIVRKIEELLGSMRPDVPTHQKRAAH